MDYAHLMQADPELYASMARELERQRDHLELIASENFTSQAVMEAVGSHLTNKYAEGYPGARYYGGCAYVDEVERLAIERVTRLFGADHANVQPHSGSQANMAVYAALLQPGDRILGMNLSHGGHLTHGSKASLSGKYFEAHFYGVDPETETIDYEALARTAEEVRPKLIIAGASAYPRVIDFARFREVADSVGAYLMVDMAHIGGLVAAGVHPSPVPYADVVTCTTHKTLRGPRGAIILCRDELAKKIDSAVFPGTQGGPLMHVIAGKAVAFKVAATPEFKDRMQRTLDGAKILAERLMADDVKNNGISVLTGGTDVHLVMVDLRNSEMDGKQGEDLLAQCGITINRNTVPFDPRPASVASGLRIGTSALATRGFGPKEYEEVADIIGTALAAGQDADVDALKARVDKLAEDFPLYPGLDQIH